MTNLPQGVTQGLVIDEPWINLILSGEKDWEMRSAPTSKRGLFGLIKKGSGTVVGTARLVDSLEQLSETQMLAAHEHHRIPNDVVRSGQVEKWRFPWVLSDIQRLETPVPYRHPPGAVVWVNLKAQDIIEQVPARPESSRVDKVDRSESLKSQPVFRAVPNSAPLFYRVSRGKQAGLILTPHKHADGSYVASKTRFEEDYVRVQSTNELIPLMQQGLSVRMSAPGVAPSLISPASIQIEK